MNDNVVYPERMGHKPEADNKLFAYVQPKQTVTPKGPVAQYVVRVRAGSHALANDAAVGLFDIESVANLFCTYWNNGWFTSGRVVAAVEEIRLERVNDKDGVAGHRVIAKVDGKERLVISENALDDKRRVAVRNAAGISTAPVIRG